MKKFAILLVILLLALTSATVLAYSVGGSILTVAPPDSVEKGNWESDQNIAFFKESDSCLDAAGVHADITAPGTYVGPSATLTPDTVGANTCVSSYFLHMDPVSGGIYLNGSVTFEKPILGVIALNSSLDASDWLGAPATYYAKAADGEIGRRVELQASSPGVDTVTLSADKKTLTVNLWVDPTWTDQVRVIVLNEIEVDIDIKPGSYPNAINVNGSGVIPVAILGSADFDVTQIDRTTLAFGGLTVRAKGNGDLQCSVKDVSGDFAVSLEGAPDGYYDLVCQFVDEDGFMDEGDGTAMVSGYLYDGTLFEGWDSIKLINE